MNIPALPLRQGPEAEPELNLSGGAWNENVV